MRLVASLAVPTRGRLVTWPAVPKGGGKLSHALTSGTCRNGSIPGRNHGAEKAERRCLMGSVCPPPVEPEEV